MEQTVLAMVDDTPDVLKARLRREWEALDARKQAGEVDDYDEISLPLSRLCLCLECLPRRADD
jgi:hypothetical protein